jgi:hypothetical protein
MFCNNSEETALNAIRVGGMGSRRVSVLIAVVGSQGCVSDSSCSCGYVRMPRDNRRKRNVKYYETHFLSKSAVVLRSITRVGMTWTAETLDRVVLYVYEHLI